MSISTRDRLLRGRASASDARSRGVTVRGSSAPGSQRGAAAPRQLVPAAVLAGLVAVAVTLAVCMAVAVIGWFLADAGAHGDTTDALRIGADAWLMGLGSTMVAGGTPLGIMPLSLTALALLGGFRCGRWAGRTAEPVRDDRALLAGSLLGGVVYVVGAVVVALLAGRGDAQPDLARAIVGGLVIGAVSVGAGLAAGTGRLQVRWQRLGRPIRAMLGGAVTAAAFVTAAGAVLVAAALLVSFNQAGRLFSGLDLGPGDALMLCVVTALFAPNAALLGVAYLVGPGFAVGTGTSVTAGSVTLGPLPAFPLLAALPGDGSPPAWLPALFAVPPLCAAVAAGLAQRRSGATEWDGAAIRGFVVGVLGAVAVTVMVALSGGPLGTGRMADIGAPAGEVLVTALGGMGIGGILGGLAVAWWQRRRARRLPPPPYPPPP